MYSIKKTVFILFFILSPIFIASFAQVDEEPINYYQMEPLDDSLFIHIQELLLIDPPDPKSEIIVDLRDPNNQTIAIKGALYPFLALPQEIRARIITYPFKLNLEEEIHYASVFSRVIEKIRFNKILQPPTKIQISSSLGYINPFLQLQGGERLGISLKQDVGISMGLGTPYSGPMETNFIEANFHILGVRFGAYTRVDALIDPIKSQNHNNIIFTEGYQINYVIPFGNFLEFGYFASLGDMSTTKYNEYVSEYQGSLVLNPDSTIKYKARVVSDNQSYINWEFRYPLSVLGSTRGKIYVSQYLNEWHYGISLREASLAGSTFDFSFDGMPKSNYREAQYNVNIMVQKIMDGWGFSAFSIGPSAGMTTLANGKFGFSKLLINVRLKIGTSL